MQKTQLSKAELERVYQALKPRWHRKHPQCCFPDCFRPAQKTPHHSRGRQGILLILVKYWKPLCWKHHNWVHANIELARKLKLICKKGLWNQAPGRKKRICHTS